MRTFLFVLACAACTTTVTSAPTSTTPELAPIVIVETPAGSSGSRVSPVVEFHNSPTRDGLYIVPGLTRAAAANTHLVSGFNGTYSGSVYGQPLYMPGGAGTTGTYFVVTETNDVVALDERTGGMVWQRSLGPYANQEGEGCTGFDPLGVTSTPVIDPLERTLYVDGVESSKPDPYGKRTLQTHLVHAISIDDGSERDGWPVDVAGVVSNDHPFDVSVAHQRGALALVGHRLYVPFGSQGDCGNYRGTVVAIDVSRVSSSASPTVSTLPPVSAWMSPGPQAGVWAPNGVASDGTSVFFATGNGGGDATSDWSGGEAIFRFTGSMKDTPDDVFIAPTWRQLDSVDGDLGGSGVVIIQQSNAPFPKLALAFGKDGNMYAVDASHMGGAVGVPALLEMKVATHDIVDSPAAVPFGGGTLVVFDAQNGGVGVNCPGGTTGDLVAVQLMPGSPPSASVAWCAPGWGHGSPIITTTDGTNEPIVWLTGGGGDNALRAYDGATGNVIYDSSDQSVAMAGMYRFNTLIAANGRLLIAANNQAFQFAWQ
jgi:hypothetical protein